MSPSHSTPSVGVIVLNYNQSKLTINCVNSLLKQEYGDFEIVVVDNNSPDPIQKDILQKELPENVALILNPKNTGYAAGNNVGAKHCVETWHSDFVFILNNDTILEDPKTIEKLVKTFENNSRVVAASPLVNTTNTGIPADKQVQVRRLLNKYKLIICNVIFLSKLPFFKSIVREFLYINWMPYLPKIYEVDSINGSAFMIRDTTLKAINYLNEKTFLYSEEVILGCQIQQLGKTCALNGQVIVTHFQGLSTGNDEKNIVWKMHKYSIDSFVIVLKDYYQASKALILLVKILRTIDFLLKKAYLWIMNIFG